MSAKTKLSFSEKDLLNQELFAKKLVTLAEIIVRKHFYASVSEKEDLVSVGVVKALNMVKSGKFSSKKGNFVTYIYTGMRNDMHNYLYHQNKFNTTDLNDLNDVAKYDNYLEEKVSYIKYSLIHTVCMKFAPDLGDFIEPLVIKGITECGFVIKGMLPKKGNHTFLCCSDLLKETYGEEGRDEIIGRIIGIILWEKKEHDETY